MGNRSEVLKLGYYRHFKGGDYYVSAVGIHTETGEAFAVYRKANREEKIEEGPVWIRPVSMFYDTVEVDGVTKPRFVKTGKENDG